MRGLSPVLAVIEEEPREPVDGGLDGLGGDRAGDLRQREVRRHQRGREVVVPEGHHDLGGPEAPLEVLGVTQEAGGAARPRGGDDLFAHRTRDHRMRPARGGEVARRVDPRELGSAVARLRPPGDRAGVIPIRDGVPDANLP